MASANATPQPSAHCKIQTNDIKDLATDFPAPRSDSRGFDVLNYDLDIRLDPTVGAISGRVAITFAAAEAKLAVLHLDLVPEMVISRVESRSQALLYEHLENRLLINLPQPLGDGESDSVAIYWSGRPPRHGSFGAGLMFRRHDPGTPHDQNDDWPIIASVSQTWSAHSWWPCKDHPADKALVSLAVTVPDSLTAISNGSLLATTTPESGWRRFVWREKFPLPTYLVSVAASNFVSWSELCATTTDGDLQLEYHVFPQDRAAAEFDLAATCDMMKFATDLLGPWPYTGEKYAQVEIKWIGGMEHPTATSLSQFLLRGDGHHENLFLHEIIHQWFGDSLTPAMWSDIWLNEGFARYGEALWVEHRYGQQAYRDFMRSIGPDRDPQLFQGAGILSAPAPILPNNLVYDKGAWVLHMLRGLMGDEAFFAFLKAYANEPGLVHGQVTTADMVAVAEREAGRSLAGFFKPWLETDLVPVISHKLIRSQDGAMELVLTQHQYPVFEIPVPVVIHSGCSTIETVAQMTRARQSFTWELDCPVDSVLVAPNGLALVRTLHSPPPALLVQGPNPNPATTNAQFELFLSRSSEVVVKIYDIKGRLIVSTPLGRLAGAEPDPPDNAPGHRWNWAPGQDGHPSPASGVYFVEFLGGGARQVKRVTLVR